MSLAPTDLKLHRKSNTLEIHYPDGINGAVSAEFLRVHSPSAEVQGHGQPILQTGKRAVRLTGIDTVGNYAIRLTFDDGHDSGLYSWGLLHHFLVNQETLWQDYLSKLAAAGERRDPEAEGGVTSFQP
ncbi:MAG: DUF971 domain-containing protein [Natronospirillum sp.]